MEDDALVLTAMALMALDGLKEHAEQTRDAALLAALDPAVDALHEVRRVVQSTVPPVARLRSV